MWRAVIYFDWISFVPFQSLNALFVYIPLSKGGITSSVAPNKYLHRSKELLEIDYQVRCMKITFFFSFFLSEISIGRLCSEDKDCEFHSKWFNNAVPWIVFLIPFKFFLWYKISCCKQDNDNSLEYNCLLQNTK